MSYFRKSFAKTKAKAKNLFHGSERSPEHQSVVQHKESLPPVITASDIPSQSKNADPSSSQSSPATSHDRMPTPMHETQMHGTKRLSPGLSARPSQLAGVNPSSSQQSLSTTLVPNPWEAWTLDQDFLYQVYIWNTKHPENTLDRIFNKISTSIERHQVLLELVPDGPIPIRGFVKALAHVVKLGTSMAEAKVAALQFAQGVLHWVEKLAAALGGGGSGRFVASAWDNLADIRKLIEDVCTWAHRMLNGGFMERASANERILEFRHEFTQAIERFGVVSNIHIGIGQDHLHRRLDSLNMHVQTIQDRLPQRQQSLPNATFQVQNKIPCDPGTRKQVLAEIMNWIEDISDGSPSFFWLSGDPGVGKSAVTASIAQECKRRRILWAQFFINRNDASTVDPQLYFPTIVKQMSDHQPVVGHAIQNILQDHPDLMKDDISIQARELFLKAVQVASRSTPIQPVAIIIDALDETDVKQLKVTAEVFSSILVDLPHNSKVFISSRVENVIRHNFAGHSRAKNIHLSARTSVADVTQFLEAKVREIMTDYNIEWSEWGQGRMRTLCSQASGLFIWAVTAVEYIRAQIADSGRECLEVVLEELNTEGMDNINTLYRTILRRTYQGKTSPWQIQRFQRIVGAILAQQTPLSIDDLKGLLDLRNPKTRVPVDVEHIVRQLRTVLVPSVREINGRTIPRVHKSFVDFITSTEAQEFRVDITASHGELALHCIDRLVLLWTGINEMPGQLRYAASHWSSHLTCVVGVPVEPEEKGDDAGSIVDEEILPSKLKDAGASEPMGTQPTGSGGRLAKAQQSSISISPDGTRIAYARGHSILLRNMETGNFNGDHLFGHTDTVRSSVFSPDGRYIASASHDQTVCIWDVETSKLVGKPLKGPSGSALAAAFSPDGTRVVSGYMHHVDTLRIWDAKTGQILHNLRGHGNTVYSAFFSPDGRHIVSSSRDGTIRIWDSTTGEAIRVLTFQEGFTAPMTVAFFSPDGKNILSAGEKIIIWDTDTGEHQYFSILVSTGFYTSETPRNR